jgi:hypothetical protein
LVFFLNELEKPSSLLATLSQVVRGKKTLIKCDFLPDIREIGCRTVPPDRAVQLPLISQVRKWMKGSCTARPLKNPVPEGKAVRIEDRQEMR